MKKLLFTIALLGGFISFGQQAVVAQENNENKASVEQVNDHNIATVTQKGNATIFVKQTANNASAVDAENVVTADQSGNSNAVIEQNGDNNTVNLHQQNNGNTLKKFEQVGSGNTAMIRQANKDGSSNDIEQIKVEGNVNNVEITQTKVGEGANVANVTNGQKEPATLLKGDENTLKVNQEGGSNTNYYTKVKGNANTVDVHQKGNGNSAGYFLVTGSDNNVKISQEGTKQKFRKSNKNNGDVIDVRGNFNKINVTQKGSDNEIEQIYTNGDRNTVDYSQSGVGNKIISQPSSGDYQTNLKGNNNAVKIEQIGTNNLVNGGVDFNGNNNQFVAKQDGDLNQLKLSPNYEYGKDWPSTNNNKVFVEQVSSNNNTSLSITGNSNVASIRFENKTSEPKTQSITQTGNHNIVAGINADPNSVQLDATAISQATYNGNNLSVIQNGDNTLEMAVNQGSVSVFQGEGNFAKLQNSKTGNISLSQLGTDNHAEINTAMGNTNVTQELSGNDAFITNSGAADITVRQATSSNTLNLTGKGNGKVNVTQKVGDLNNVNIDFTSSNGDVDIIQNGSRNNIHGLEGAGSSAQFSGSTLNITQDGTSNVGYINANGYVSLSQIGNSNSAKITQK